MFRRKFHTLFAGLSFVGLSVACLTGAGGAWAGVRSVKPSQPSRLHAPATPTVIVTNATSGWLVLVPHPKRFKPAVLTDQNVLWADPLAGSSWTAKKWQDGDQNVRGGFYTYQFSFCPALVSGTPFITLSVLADNAFDVLLNGNSFDPTRYRASASRRERARAAAPSASAVPGTLAAGPVRRVGTPARAPGCPSARGARGRRAWLVAARFALAKSAVTPESSTCPPWPSPSRRDAVERRAKMVAFAFVGSAGVDRHATP
jgi:hypothetical protein